MSRYDDDGGSHEYEVEVKCLKITDGGALMLRRSDNDEVFFVPEAVVHDDSEVWKKGDNGKLVVRDRFAEQEGWA